MGSIFYGHRNGRSTGQQQLALYLSNNIMVCTLCGHAKEMTVVKSHQLFLSELTRCSMAHVLVCTNAVVKSHQLFYGTRTNAIL